MSSDKRQFSDFKSFPGQVSDGAYHFPDVLKKDSMGRMRKWIIIVRIIHEPKPARRKINWVDTDRHVPIIPQMYQNGSWQNGLVAQIWTEQGIIGSGYKSTKSIPSYVTKGKNIGRSNETNIFTQALIVARSKYLAKAAVVSTNRVYPMAVHKYDVKPRDVSRHIRYPVAVQRKLDGGRAVAFFDGKTTLYTRKLKDLQGNKNILDQLDVLYKSLPLKYKNVYLDGEIYKHGMSLQEISGIMRRDASDARLEYHIFDVFFLDKPLPFVERTKVLDQIFECEAGPLLIKVKTHIAKDKKEEDALYEQFLREKYEGSIVRNLDAPYEFSSVREKRSYQNRKRKPRYSAEYKIVGFAEGEKGKDIGAIIWELETKKGIRFTATPVGVDYEERYALFRQMSQKFTAKNKLMTVEYDDISKDGVPLRAKAKCIRVI